MGLFYQPPPPPLGTSAATPPQPHVPLRTPGSQPPRYTTALMLTAVLASWPLDLEPRLQRPNNQQQKIAPLTLTYGQPPPIVGTPPAARFAILSSWPADLEPRLASVNALRQTIAPLTLAYGSSPPIAGAAAVIDSTILASWPRDLEPRLGGPNNRQQAIAPLTLIYGDQPPRTLKPPISAWPVELPIVQGSTKSVAATLPLIAFVPAPSPPSVIWAAWTDAFLRFQTPVTIAPLTLASGTPPTPRPPMAVSALIAAVAAWTPTWDAQAAPKNAAWNQPPILSAVAYAPLPALIWTAWQPAWVPPPRPIAIVALTLPTGTAPPPRAGSDRQLVVLPAWTLDGSLSPRPAPIAPFVLVPGTVPWTPPPFHIIRTWQDDAVAQRRPVAIAPLALAYGQAPPVKSPLAVAPATIIGLAWPPDLEPRLLWPNTTQVHVAPLTLPRGQAPPPRAPISAAYLTVIGVAWQPPFILPRGPLCVTAPNGLLNLPVEFFLIGAQDRSFVVEAAGRFIAVPAKGYVFSVDAEGRVTSVPDQDRDFEVDE